MDGLFLPAPWNWMFLLLGLYGLLRKRVIALCERAYTRVFPNRVPIVVTVYWDDQNYWREEDDLRESCKKVIKFLRRHKIYVRVEEYGNTWSLHDRATGKRLPESYAFSKRIRPRTPNELKIGVPHHQDPRKDPSWRIGV